MSKRLQTLGDVRRYLAGLLNRYEAKEIDEVKWTPTGRQKEVEFKLVA